MLFYNKLDDNYSNLNKLIGDVVSFETDQDKKLIVNCIVEKGNNYTKLRKSFIEKISSSKIFKLVVSDTIVDDLYNTQIKSNIKFSKIFSEYIIDKSYSQSVVLENLQEVSLKLIGSTLINELFEENYKKRYIVHLNDSLYSKDRKISSFIDNFNDPFSQKKILISIDDDVLKKYKNKLNKFKNSGFNFIIQIQKSTLMNAEFDRNILEMGEYIFVVGDENKKEIESFVPKDLINNTYCISEPISSEVIKL